MSVEKWAAFGMAIMRAARDQEIGDLDGGTIQDIGEDTGVLVPTLVDGPCGEGCRCAEYDDFPMLCFKRIAYPGDEQVQGAE